MQGVSLKEYGQVMHDMHASISAYTAPGAALSVIPGRVSYTFQLKGAALAVDTACSSSLVSMHLAMSSLHSRQTLRAFNSGVNLTLVPDTSAMFQRAGMMSPEGRCKTLDAAADGYVRGEAVATALLQPVEAMPGAEEIGGEDDTTHFCLLVRGSAVNQGGRSSTLTAPNGPSQQEVLRNAMQDAAVAPADIFGLQMHGTGRFRRNSLSTPLSISRVMFE